MKKIFIAILAVIVLLPGLTFASFDASLKYGSRGQAVSDLQDFLVAENYLTGKVDGHFGLMTLKAVKAFQTANNLSADGYFGLASRNVANTILAKELQASNGAEQTETGIVSVPSTVKGCTDTSLFSPLSGQPCKSTTQPVTQNLPDGCLSTAGYSITTGQACNGVVMNVGQIAQTVQQIQTNTAQIVQNTTPTPTISTPTLPTPPSSSVPAITTNTPTITMYTLTTSTSSTAIPPTGQITEQQVRQFCATLMPNVNWQLMCKNADFKAVAKSLTSNGFGISPDPNQQ